jgi:transcription termination/antitermination protein NusG
MTDETNLSATDKPNSEETASTGALEEDDHANPESFDEDTARLDSQPETPLEATPSQTHEETASKNQDEMAPEAQEETESEIGIDPDESESLVEETPVGSNQEMSGSDETSESDTLTTEEDATCVDPSVAGDAPADGSEATAGEDEISDEKAKSASKREGPENPNLKWYVVHTYSMYEDKAKLALFERIKQNSMEHKFGEVLVPKTAHEQILKSGKKKRVEKTSFPGYILVEMDLDETTNHLVCGTPKITGFVGNARNPRPISDAEVLRLTAPEDALESAKPRSVIVNFEKGETVKVIDGAFTNFDGMVEDVDSEKMKLRILVSIFGRETPVELDYGQVRKI